jgi:hypothetical protein
LRLFLVELLLYRDRQRVVQALGVAVNSTIRLDREHKVEVAETRQQIVNAVNALGTIRVPLVELTRPDGSKVSVNADRIRLIAEN